MEMTVSGDGRQVYLLQHPARFDPWGTFRMSADGRFWAPKTNRMNPNEFRFHWLAKEWKQEELFDMLQAKNRFIMPMDRNQLEIQLAAALQEGDGEMVVKLLEIAKGAGAKLTVPFDRAEDWSSYLRGQYEGADRGELLSLLSNAGKQSVYIPVGQPSEQEGVKRSRLTVPFKKSSLFITVANSGGKLLELKVEANP